MKNSVEGHVLKGNWSAVSSEVRFPINIGVQRGGVIPLECPQLRKRRENNISVWKNILKQTSNKTVRIIGCFSNASFYAAWTQRNITAQVWVSFRDVSLFLQQGRHISGRNWAVNHEKTKPAVHFFHKQRRTVLKEVISSDWKAV